MHMYPSEIDFEYEVMIDRLLEPNSVSLPQMPVGKADPLDSFPRPVLDRLPQVIFLELRTDAHHFDQILQAPVDLDGQVAEGASHRELGRDFLIFVVARMSVSISLKITDVSDSLTSRRFADSRTF
jgi:hypothetical protein